MIATGRRALAVAGLAIATQAAAQVTFYEHPGFRGQSVTADRPVGNLERYGFNNRASSAVVNGEPWEVCDGPGFSGRCVVLRPGRYDSLGSMGMNDSISSVRPMSARGPEPRHAPGPAPSAAQITFYEHPGLRGQSVTAERRVRNLERFGFNNRASSAVVAGDAWELCSRADFRGRCVVLRPGRYDSLGDMGLNDRVSSARPVDRDRDRDRRR
jgi:beta/gamma crystallin